ALSCSPDDDLHVDFVTAASNLRAGNYGIPGADRLASKRLMGRIVPAIATTTMAVAGLACLEIYKLAWGCRERGCYRRSNVYLSSSLLLRGEPGPPDTYWYGQREWSCWERLEVQAAGADGREMTLRELLEWLEASAAARAGRGPRSPALTPAPRRARTAGPSPCSCTATRCSTTARPTRRRGRGSGR
uniref:Ubiquitin-activating enzyme SCCH domain-containing protein n=1 Tax=Nothoprocta perdicaria TaxID=30464 RepID=A0A8C6ZTS4_NOTPE